MGSVTRHDDIRAKALADLQRYEVLMLDGHFDFGNGYHGRVYLNPHQLFRQPSTIWRFTQDLIDVLPGSILEATEVVAGPATGGALLAHTIAGLLDSRRDITRPPTLFAPLTGDSSGNYSLSRFYQQQVKGRSVLLVDDVRNTGHTLSRCAKRCAGGVQSTGELSCWCVSALRRRHAGDNVLRSGGVPSTVLSPGKTRLYRI